MRNVTKELIDEFKIKRLGYDFMGYEKQRGDDYMFHHLLIPNRFGGPYEYWNGVVLFTTPHRYLHVIEAWDEKRFNYLTSEMQDMKVKGYLDNFNLNNINDLLSEFEYINRNKYTSKGKKLIKSQYLNRHLKKF